MKICRILYTALLLIDAVLAEDTTVAWNITVINATLTTPVTAPGNVTDVTKNQHCIRNYGICLSSNQSCLSSRARVSGICDNSNDDCCIATLDERNTWKTDDGECLKKYGECMLETHSCNGSFGNFKCGGIKHRKCCVPTEDDINSWTDHDKDCQRSMGNCQIDLDKCNGSYQAGKCGGPAHRQCCLPESSVQKKWEDDDEKCQEKWGSCKFRLDECSGKYESGLCGGPEQRSCCVPDQSTKDSWKDDDKKCLLKFGQCQHKSENCTLGSQYEEGLCGGPKYRQCCRPDSETISKWEADDSRCSDKSGVCQNTVKKCNKPYLPDLCGGPGDIRQCCPSPAKDEDAQPDHTSQSEKETNAVPPTKHQDSNDKRTLVLSVSIPVLILLVMAILCIVRKRGCCKRRRSLRGDPKKMPWYKMEYNELEEDDEGVNLTALEETPTYA